MKLLARGKRGIVYLKNKNVIKRKLTEHYHPKDEARYLKILNKKGIGPKLVSFDDNEIEMQFIKGERIIDYIQKSSKKDIIKIIKKIFEQLYTMDKLGINKLELTNPYKHILIKNKKPFMIDFERCIFTEKPKNVTQFIQFLCSEKMNYVFKEKSIFINKKHMFALAQEYKNNYSKIGLNKIIEEIR